MRLLSTLLQVFLFMLVLNLGLTSCTDQPAKDDNKVTADVIFVGKHIVTMDAENETAQAVAIKGENIIFVGNETAAQAYAGPETRMVELGKRALLPGFIDAHGHFTSTARFINFANLSPRPVGKVADIPTLIQALQDYADQQEQAPDWIVGYGYDDSLLAEKRHPTRDDLDQVSSRIPITIIHVSYHFAVVNSAALKVLKITAQTPDPKGGVIRRQKDSQVPNGVLEETATHPAFYPLSKISPEQFEQVLRKVANYYASYGITTAQDGAGSQQDLDFLRSVASKEQLPIDLNIYQGISATASVNIAEFTAENTYTNGIKLAGAKFFLDGSPQGRTAWLTQPYVANKNFPQENYVAYTTTDKMFYQDAIQTLFANNIQAISHANGDAAIDLMLDSLEKATRNQPESDHRFVIIHAQLMRQDQIKRAKALNAIPSFFSAHPFFWGDWHRLNFGDDRASNISPTRWAENAGMRFTIHNDAPVVPPDMMRLLWITTNRETRSGHILGDHQRLSVSEALRAMTINAAYQNFEENQKGSIRSGKQADLVILDKNPLLADIKKLNEIKVLETIARGKTIYIAP